MRGPLNNRVLYRKFSNTFEIKKGIVNLVAQTVKNLPAKQVTRVRSLGLEDPLEKGMATHSSILAWRIPLSEQPGGLQSTRSQRVWQDWAIFTFTLVNLYQLNLSLTHNVQIIQDAGRIWNYTFIIMFLRKKALYIINAHTLSFITDTLLHLDTVPKNKVFWFTVTFEEHSRMTWRKENIPKIYFYFLISIPKIFLLNIYPL